MRIRRFAAAAATVAAGALVLSGCAAPQSEIVEGSSLSVAWNQPFYSYNGNTSFGNATANNNITYATLGGFNYYNDVPELVKDTSFGTYELVSEDPLVVKYTIADGVKWSDGTAVDAADLLLQWAALSRALDTPDFDASEFTDPDTGEFTDDFPTDVVYFDSGADPSVGLGLVSTTPEVSDDKKSITMTYDEPFVDWELQLTSPLPAHVVAKNALGIEDNQEAKDAIYDAIENDDAEALAAISSFWNSGFNFTEMPDNTDLVLASGPYMITDFVADQYVTLTANPEYTGDNLPKVEEITVRFITDPLAAVQALQNGEVQLISPQATADVAEALAALDVTVIGGYEGTYEHIDLQFDQSKSGHFNNPLIREAFMKVIPRQEIVDKLIKPLQEDAEVRNSQVFLPGAEGYDESVAENGSEAYAEVDIEGAKALLAEAGVTNPEVCMLFSSTNPRRANEFLLIQQSAAQAGFNVTDCSSPDWGGLLGTPGAYDASLFGWQSTSLGVTNGPPPTYTTGGINNLNFYSNPEMDELTAALGKEFDPDAQIEIMKQIDKILWDDFYGVTIFQFPAVTAYDQNAITNISPSTLAPTIFWNIWDWEPVSADAE
ncbi:ABC transporter family substrate-binding protein [Salinibacterium soli]|uniref:ABC transporter family substrate-binding protein n=1 Tax=Antiquaquibacter soli TaxID=3064523 RepID=A0ABT9BJV4_9MICO|nr:ABC transporter family substrate-binding protein [Protaetiibacter sp. WY-16]MDO7881301.1 ABC transporter family substrate-binding protein [Protaetiibacter sp. WY-16]